MGLKTTVANQSKRKRNTSTNPPELLQEIVWEILVRLPVETLVRFKSVSKAWHAIISDTAFVRAQFIRSRQTPEQHQSFLITPHVLLDPNKRGPAKPLSTNIRFYQQRLVQDDDDEDDSNGCSRDTATLLYGRHFPAGEFRTVTDIAHCDGLVLLPTNTKAYIFNPATRDTIVLPVSRRNVLPLRRTCLPIGLGLDASTGRYKVARAFYRPSNNDPSEIVAMGMEVFTINNCQQDNNGSCWRETLEDPPFFMLTKQTAIHCKGCLFFFIDKKYQQQPSPPPQGLIRFRLDNETFGVLPLLPYVYPRIEDDDLLVSELDGELCVSFFSKPMQRILIWMTRDILTDDPHWSCLYMIHVPARCRPIMASSLGSAAGFLILRGGDCVFRYDLEGREVVLNLGNLQNSHDGRISCLGMSSDGSALCTGSWDKKLKYSAVLASFHRKGPHSTNSLHLYQGTLQPKPHICFFFFSTYNCIC